MLHVSQASLIIILWQNYCDAMMKSSQVYHSVVEHDGRNVQWLNGNYVSLKGFQIYHVVVEHHDRNAYWPNKNYVILKSLQVYHVVVEHHDLHCLVQDFRRARNSALGAPVWTADSSAM